MHKFFLFRAFKTYKDSENNKPFLEKTCPTYEAAKVFSAKISPKLEKKYKQYNINIIPIQTELKIF